MLGALAIIDDMQKTVNVFLNITADEYIRVYQGSARFIQATSREGKTVRFPANILQPFVTRDGIYGDFTIVCDQNNRFQQVIRG